MMTRSRANEIVNIVFNQHFSSISEELKRCGNTEEIILVIGMELEKMQIDLEIELKKEIGDKE